MRKPVAVPDEPELVLGYLKSIDEKVDRMANDMRDLKVRVTSLKANVATINYRLDRIDDRLDRIEKRLDLVDHR